MRQIRNQLRRYHRMNYIYIFNIYNYLKKMRGSYKNNFFLSIHVYINTKLLYLFFREKLPG